MSEMANKVYDTEVTDELNAALQSMCQIVKDQLNAKGAKLGMVHAAITFLPVSEEMQPATDATPAVICTFGREPFIMNAVAGIVHQVALEIFKEQSRKDDSLDAFAAMLGVGGGHAH